MVALSLASNRVEDFGMGVLTVQTVAEVDHYMAQVRASALRARDWVATQSGDPLDLLRRMKFDAVGYHPIEDRPLNFIEQINQTWTFAVALAAARQLLALQDGP
jgi:hypothetical protein